jgi:hypothetical protein
MRPRYTVWKARATVLQKSQNDSVNGIDDSANGIKTVQITVLTVLPKVLTVGITVPASACAATEAPQSSCRMATQPVSAMYQSKKVKQRSF